MRIFVKYIYNQTSNSIIEHGSEIMDFPEYDYDEIFDNPDLDNKLNEEIKTILKSEYGFYSVKVTGYSEV